MNRECNVLESQVHVLSHPVWGGVPSRPLRRYARCHMLMSAMFFILSLLARLRRVTLVKSARLR